MNKRVCFALLFATITVPSFGGQIASVKYVQDVIRNTWSDFGQNAIVKYRALEDGYAANMLWLLKAVDVANGKIGAGKTNYGETPQATTQAADTIVVEEAARKLIKPNTIYLKTDDSDYFEFVINAYGNFTVTCGDGTQVPVTKGDKITCRYGSSDNDIVVTGTATGYDTTNIASVISFIPSKWRLLGIEGSFAGMFPVIDGVQPIFNTAFYNCYNLQYVSDTLFANLYDVETLRDNTFTQAFYGTALTESVKLFGKPLYEIWPDATQGQVGKMYQNVSTLSDAAVVPSVWK